MKPHSKLKTLSKSFKEKPDLMDQEPEKPSEIVYERKK